VFATQIILVRFKPPISACQIRTRQIFSSTCLVALIAKEMAGDNTHQRHETDRGVDSVVSVDETTPLLSTQTKTAYVTECVEEKWKPSAGFWWIETGKNGNKTKLYKPGVVLMSIRHTQ